MSWAQIRAPLLAAGAAMPAVGAESMLPTDPRVRAAVAVASPDLTAALARTPPTAGAARRLGGKLDRYLIRMSTRPTPYGLFAGVGLVEWGASTNLALTSSSPRTRSRPDMGWLLSLVERLEQDPLVRPAVLLGANPAVVQLAGRAYPMSGRGPSVSIRSTGAVRRALELARAPITAAALVEALAALPGATTAKAQAMVSSLWEQGLLVSDLRPPLTGADQARHVLDRLVAIPAAADVATGLADLLAALRSWDGLPLGDRAGPWQELMDRAGAVHPPPDAKSVIQTDMALPLAGTHLHAHVGQEAARAAELLLRLSPLVRGLPYVEAYRHAFEARYGSGRMVALGELLDPDHGLGPLTAQSGDGAAPAFSAPRHQLLRDLALDANRDRRLVVELDDAMVERLAPVAPTAAGLPSSVDVSVFVAAASPAAIDRGDFRVVVGPNVGATPAGRAAGRFADLLGPQATDALDEVAAAQAALAPGCILAELVYPPEQARSANVAIRPAPRSHQIVIGAVAGGSRDAVVPLDELVVGVRGGRFVVHWPRSGAEIVAVQGHMLNLMQAPPAARFLLEVAADARSVLLAFDWGPAAGFGFLPRVQHGRVVLALAQWRLDPRSEGLEGTVGAAFDAALASWRSRWSVPRHVYLATGDNRLLLDLDDPRHRVLLGEELAARPGRAALVQEALPGPADAWLPGPDGGHIVELMVPVALDGPAPVEPTGEPAATASVSVSRADRVRLPGSEWLYLKLYGPRSSDDELIGGPLRSFAEFATGSGLAKGWFFLRYADPDPHLRVRFHGEPRALLGPLLTQICGWAGELVADGARTSFGFDTYEREIERYGGPEGTALAEDVFAADSAAVTEILAIGAAKQLPQDPLTVAVLSCDDLLAGLGLDPAERLTVLQHAVEPSRADGQEYRCRQRELRALLGDRSALAASSDGPALAAVLAARRAALAPTAELMAQLQRGGRLGRSVPELCASHLHMHLNRLLGTDHARERLVLALLRRARTGLSRAPLG